MNQPADEFGNAAEARWTQFQNMPGNEFTFKLGRTPNSISRDGDDKFFSADAMNTLFDHIATYVGSRLVRYHERYGRAPAAMTVRIRVALDLDPDAFVEEGDDAVTFTVGDNGPPLA